MADFVGDEVPRPFDAPGGVEWRSGAAFDQSDIKMGMIVVICDGDEPKFDLLVGAKVSPKRGGAVEFLLDAGDNRFVASERAEKHNANFDESPSACCRGNIVRVFARVDSQIGHFADDSARSCDRLSENIDWPRGAFAHAVARDVVVEGVAQPFGGEGIGAGAHAPIVNRTCRQVSAALGAAIAVGNGTECARQISEGRFGSGGAAANEDQCDKKRDL